MRYAVVVAVVASFTFASADTKPRKKTQPPAPEPMRSVFDLRGLMTPAERTRTGLDKLTDEETNALGAWMTNLMVRLLSRPAEGFGVVRTSTNDEKFVIETRDGRSVFKARTYCFGIDEGDEVFFAESTSVCISNKFMVKGDGDVCEVWCE